MTQPGELFAERFEIEHVIREAPGGGMFRARDREGGETVALKVAPSDNAPKAAAFMSEARVVAGLDHPALGRHVAHGITEDGGRYLATAWIEGVSLSARLSQGALSIEECLSLGARVADGLAAAHAAGLVHGAIHPANVILAGGEAARAVVLDLGLVREPSPALVSAEGLTQGGAVYLSPEQVANRISWSPPVDADPDAGPVSVGPRIRVVGPHSDLFLLGCMLYECVAGRPAFSGTYVLSALAKVLVAASPPLRRLREEVPEALESLVNRMLAKAPEARPPGCAEVIAVLGDIERRRAPGHDAAAAAHEGDHVETDLRVPPLVLSKHVWLLVVAGPGERDEAALQQVNGLVASFEASARWLLDGSLIVRIDPERVARALQEPAPSPPESPLELGRNAVLLGRLRRARIQSLGGERAARLALGVRAAIKGAPIVLTMTPRCRPGEWASSQQLEWATKLLDRGVRAGLQGVVLDKESADVLSVEVFNVTGTGDLLELRGAWARAAGG